MKNWIIQYLLFVGFISYVSFSSYASVLYSQPSENEDSARAENEIPELRALLANLSENEDSARVLSHFIMPKTAFASTKTESELEEIGTHIEEGLLNLGMSDTQGLVMIPLSAEGEEVVSRVAVVDPATKKCVMYNNNTKEMFICDEGDTAYVYRRLDNSQYVSLVDKNNYISWQQVDSFFCKENHENLTSNTFFIGLGHFSVGILLTSFGGLRSLPVNAGTILTSVAQYLPYARFVFLLAGGTTMAVSAVIWLKCSVSMVD